MADVFVIGRCLSHNDIHKGCALMLYLTKYSSYSCVAVLFNTKAHVLLVNNMSGVY